MDKYDWIILLLTVCRVLLGISIPIVLVAGLSLMITNYNIDPDYLLILLVGVILGLCLK